MGKKTGRLLLFIVGLVGVLKLGAQSSISYAITDFQEKKLAWVGAGVPFLLIVTVTGDAPIAGDPIIEGLDQFSVRNGGIPSTNYYIVNGVTTCVQPFKYIVRIDKTGNYQIGPVTIKNKQGTVSAPARMLTVKDESHEVDQKEISDAVLRLEIDPMQGYQGQKFTLKIRLYLTGSAMLSQLLTPEFTGFIVGTFKEVTAGLETINGLEYRFVDYEVTMVPQQIGNLRILPMEAEYQIASKRRSGFGFMRLFDQDTEYRRVISNELMISAKPLPEAEKLVDGIGIFSKVVAGVNQTNVQVGQGVVYTLTVEGDADLERTVAPALQLPSELVSYTSKVFIQEANIDRGAQKHFEYIIQAQQPGTIIIPSQEFVFFDPVQEKYRALQTQPIELSVVPIPEQQVNEHPTDQTYQAISYDEPTDILLPLNEHGPWMPIRYRQIPFGWFIVALLLPLLLGFIFFVWNIYQWYYDKNITYFAYKAAYKKAYSSLEVCKEQRNAGALYDIFIRLIAARMHVMPSVVNDEYIRHKLPRYFSAEQWQAWQKMYKTVQEIRFYGKTADAKIYDQAEQWLHLFEEVL
ncbi:MAG: BatD family protein [Candidatus Babeliales bacterium]